MAKYVEPIRDMHSLRVNRTLHGRSVHRPQNVSGHNVFKGYNNPGTGDAIDLFCRAGEPVYAIADGTQIRWQNDTTRLEVIYLQGEGWLAVYAHIDASHEGVNAPVSQGEVVGHVRGDLNDPHLHFELWLAGSAVHAPTAGKLRMRMMSDMGLSDQDSEDSEPRLIVAKKTELGDDDTGFRMNDLLYNEIPSRFDHRNVPIRQALRSLGITNAVFDINHLDSREDPRVYVFVL